VPLFVRRHPFLLLGLLALSLFFGVEALARTGHANAAAAASGPLRVLILPMYVVWLPFTVINGAVAGPDGSPEALARLIWICGLIAGLVPYALADYLLVRWRRYHANAVAAT
jgi:hypothetical protein